MRLRACILPGIILCLLTLLAACSDPEVDRTLRDAEALMELRPDSSLTILETINGATLSGERRARHALLLSQAYDKNNIDLTSDSLISIAANYYSDSPNLRYKMLSLYYTAVVYMNQHNYDKALSIAVDIIKIAEKAGDITRLAQINHLIARAYLFTYNHEGAKEHFHLALQSSRKLQKSNWIGLCYLNLANLALQKQDFSKAVEYSDSAKSYLPDDQDILEYEILAQIGLGHYELADSIYQILNSTGSPSLQVQTYKLLADFQLGKSHEIENSLSNILKEATHSDSIEAAAVGSHIYRCNGNYEQALKYNDVLIKESNRVIENLSNHSLYKIQLEREKRDNIEQRNKLRNRTQLTIFIITVSVLIIIICVIYIYFNHKRNREQIAKTENELLLISSEYSELLAEINGYKQTQSNLSQQVICSQIAARELFASKYAWIEELGNILLDSEASKSASNRALKDLTKRLETVKDKQFISQLIDVINKYRKDIIARIITDCSEISDTELNILALLCAGLSTRIISFILNIKPQSIYNAKSSIKRKLQSQSPTLLNELDDIFA